VEDTKSHLSSISFVEFRHIRWPWDDNQAAHHMAKLALALPFEQVRMGECPCPIQAIVLAEQAC